MKIKTLIVTLLALGTYANAQEPGTGNKPMPVSPPGVSMQHSSEGQPKHDDNQIVDIVKTANDGEIAANTLGESKATRPDVKDFASHMVKQHTEANAKLEKLVKKENLQFTDNDTSRGMKTNSEKTAGHLKSVKTEDFDREFMDAQLADHKQVLTSLDENLIPNAKNKELKAFLKDVRKTVAHHLEMAKKVSTDVTSKK